MFSPGAFWILQIICDPLNHVYICQEYFKPVVKYELDMWQITDNYLKNYENKRS